MAESAIPAAVAVYELQETLVLGNPQAIREAAVGESSVCRVLIVRMHKTVYLDEAALRELAAIRDWLAQQDIHLILSEIHTLPFMLAMELGIAAQFGEENITGSFEEAVERARSLALKS